MGLVFKAVFFHSRVWHEAWWLVSFINIHQMMEWMDENIIEWIHVWMNKISSRKKSYKILWIRAIEISIGWDQEASPSPDSFALWQLLQFLSSSLPSFFLFLSLSLLLPLLLLFLLFFLLHCLWIASSFKEHIINKGCNLIFFLPFEEQSCPLKKRKQGLLRSGPL